MQYTQLAQFRQRIRVGARLPFNVYDEERTLLLARGQTVTDAVQLEALYARGAVIDVDEFRHTAERVRAADPAELPALWDRCLHHLSDTLRSASHETFRGALEAAAPPVMALVERDPDLAILQVLRQDGNQHVQYGVTHATHTAITAYLVAQRLGWAPADAQRAFKVALTMNVSMFELQGRLAEQTAPPDAAQRAEIQAHPELSRMLLEVSGVDDEEWLQAVVQHHESPDGLGYPYGLRHTNDTAALVRRADIYTAKLSPRATRAAMAADVAGRQMFMQDSGHPMTAALVKEFGVYPPGCWVRLASGEVGVVVRRGPTVTTPVVAVMSSAGGVALATPIRRDSTARPWAVVGVVAHPPSRRRVPTERLMAAVAP